MLCPVGRYITALKDNAQITRLTANYLVLVLTGSVKTLDCPNLI